jgi:hypothetical protein
MAFVVAGRLIGCSPHIPTAFSVVASLIVTAPVYNIADPEPGTAVVPSTVYQIPVFSPESVIVTACDPLADPPLGEIVGAVLAVAEQVGVIVFPLCIGGSDWCSSFDM